MQANALPEFQYPAPTIIVQPIEIYRFRYIIDLKDHFVPLVGGDDPTGPKICVTVPAATNDRMYLGVQAFTLNDERHPLKMTIPRRATLNRDFSSAHDGLSSLAYVNHDSSDSFDRDEGRVYLEIHAADHQAQNKEVNVAMVTLRRQLRTNRAIYVRQQLDLCKLGFSIYIATAEGFQHVSPWSFSRTIRPRKQSI